MWDEIEHYFLYPYPICALVGCKHSVKYGGYPGNFSRNLYCKEHSEEYTTGEFIALIFEEDENFVV